MNEWEINQARDRYRNHPVLRKATQFLSDYRDQVNAHSDGWPYWSVAVHAARQLIALIQHPDTATDQAFRKSLAPIKSFYTRRGKAAGMTFPTMQEHEANMDWKSQMEFPLS